MSRVEELESQIKSLSCSEFQELRAWLAEHDAEIWDRQFHDDDPPGEWGMRLAPSCGGPKTAEFAGMR